MVIDWVDLVVVVSGNVLDFWTGDGLKLQPWKTRTGKL